MYALSLWHKQLSTTVGIHIPLETITKPDKNSPQRVLKMHWRIYTQVATPFGRNHFIHPPPPFKSFLSRKAASPFQKYLDPPMRWTDF